ISPVVYPVSTNRNVADAGDALSHASAPAMALACPWLSAVRPAASRHETAVPRSHHRGMGARERSRSRLRIRRLSHVFFQVLAPIRRSLLRLQTGAGQHNRHVVTWFAVHLVRAGFGYLSVAANLDLRTMRHRSVKAQLDDMVVLQPQRYAV